jgi:inorganic phosphate transporter, PiT family
VEAVVLVAVAVLYALVNGLNDGGALTGAAIQGGRLRPLAVVGLLSAALVVVPLVAGAPVAETLATRLVDFGATDGQRALVVAVLVAVLVAGGLAWAKLPTSLTLATVGGVVGVGVGSDLGVDNTEVVRVLILAAAAPVMGGLVAFVLMGLARLSVVSRLGRAGRVRTVTTGMVALAYAANDGQKMIAVAVVAGGAQAATAARPGALLLVGLAAVFALGAVLGMRRAGGTLGHGVLAGRPSRLAASEVSAAGAVAVTGWLGAPVSMTQSLAGSLGGSGITDGVRRVRWRLASRLLLAWVVTFPAAFALAALLVEPAMDLAPGGGT